MSYIILITLARYNDRSCPLGEMGRRNIINEQRWPRHPSHPPFAPSAKRKSALSTKDGAPSTSCGTEKKREGWGTQRNCSGKSGRLILYRHCVLILLALACSASAQNCELKDYKPV